MIPRGKVAAAPPKFTVRAITRDDLPRLRQPRDKSVSHPGKLRDSHHNIARLLAIGTSTSQVAALTGYSVTRVSALASAPAMVELVAYYRSRVDESWQAAVDAFQEMSVRNMIAAERQLSDRLDEADAEGETLPVRELIAITADRADRFGYGKHTTQTNVNIDFAARLEERIARNRAKVIEGRVTPQSAAGTDQSSTPAPPQPLRRLQ